MKIKADKLKWYCRIRWEAWVWVCLILIGWAIVAAFVLGGVTLYLHGKQIKTLWAVVESDRKYIDRLWGVYGVVDPPPVIVNKKGKVKQ